MKDIQHPERKVYVYVYVKALVETGAFLNTPSLTGRRQWFNERSLFCSTFICFDKFITLLLQMLADLILICTFLPKAFDWF